MIDPPVEADHVLCVAAVQSPRPSAKRRSADLGIEGTAGGSVGIFPLGISVTDEQFQPWCRLSASEAMPTRGTSARERGDWAVISMKNDWKRVFFFE